MKKQKTKMLIGVSIITLIAMTWIFSSCSKSDTTPPTDFSALNAEITAAQNLLSTTTEGVGVGEYVRGSQAILQAAITAAQAIAANTKATQSDVTNATAQLTQAVTAYQASAIVPIAPESLVGQWTFDELTSAAVGTTVKDYSGNSHNGTLQAGASYWSTAAGYPYATYPAPATNVPTITTDRYGDQHALHFLAGANVDVPYNSAFTPSTAITVTLWAKADTLPDQSGGYKYYPNNYMIALSRWNGWKFNIQDSPRAFFTVNTGSPHDHDNNVTLNGICKWIHYAVTYTSGTETFYVNGVATYTWTDVTGTLVQLNGAAGTATAPVDLVIGQDLPTSAYSDDSNSPFYLNWGGYFIGAMDDIRIYNTALSDQQVQSIYDQEKP